MDARQDPGRPVPASDSPLTASGYLAVPPGTPLVERLHLYTSYGWALVPILPVDYVSTGDGDKPGKSPFKELLSYLYDTPRIEHLKLAPALPEEVFYWFEHEPEMNLAVFPTADTGLVVMDIDDLDLFNPSLLTPTASSGREEGGKHLYFSCSATVKREKFEWGHLNPEYAVLPGSIHSSGQMYEWLPGLSPEEVPLMPFVEALDVLAALEAEG